MFVHSVFHLITRRAHNQFLTQLTLGFGWARQVYQHQSKQSKISVWWTVAENESSPSSWSLLQVGLRLNCTNTHYWYNKQTIKNERIIKEFVKGEIIFSKVVYSAGSIRKKLLDWYEPTYWYRDNVKVNVPFSIVYKN